MAISYLGCTEERVANHVRTRKIRDGYLVTNDYGGWAYLSSPEYRKFNANKMDYSLKSSLAQKGLVLGREDIEAVISDYRQKNLHLFQGASLHIVVPTLRCNLKCSYCHAKSQPANASGFDMDEEIARKTVDFIFQSPSKAITIEFQGGEPLLNFPIVKEVVQYAKKTNKRFAKDLKFSLVSNLCFMTDEIFKFLTTEEVGICTSLDGNKEVHDKNRQEYSKTSEWIRKIGQKNHINAMMIATKNSIGKEREIVQEYVEQGLDTIWLKAANKLGNGIENWQDAGLSANEFLAFWKKALDIIVKETKLRENSTYIILKKILFREAYNFADMQSPCGAAIAQLAYNYDGSIYSCDEARQYELFKLGTVENRYKDILTSRETQVIVRASINDNPACEVCAFKPYCGVCPVCSFADTGNIIPKLPNRRCEILKAQFEYVFEKLLFDEEYRKVFLKWIT